MRGKLALNGPHLRFDMKIQRCCKAFLSSAPFLIQMTHAHVNPPYSTLQKVRKDAFDVMI